MGLIDLDLAFAAVSVIAAGLVYGFAGFGSGYMLIPIFSLIYGPREAIGMVAITATLGAAGMMFKTARRTDWRQIGPICVLATLTTPFGVAILLSVEPELMRRVIGAVILILAVALLMGVSYRGTRNMITSSVAGVVVGLVHGAVGLGGLTASLYVFSSQQSAMIQRAGIVVISGIVSAVAVVVMTAHGTIDAIVAARSLLLMIPFGITVWFGTRVFRVTPGPVFRRIVLAFVMTLGIITLVA